MASLTDPEISAFLTAGTRTGKIAWTSADGRPLVAPVWFVVEDGCVVFNTGKETAKGRALARDPRAALCADLEEPPYAFVQVQGNAELRRIPANCCAPRPRSRRGTWARSGPRSSGSATGYPASWWSGCVPPRS
jgi:PPOX class probable F420-dependent enzyme